MSFSTSSPFELASFGELIGDPSRAAMLLALMDGSARPASELAEIARVTPATASAHLARMVRGRLMLVEPIGRHRYFRLAGTGVAEALESVVAIFAPPPKKPLDPARLALVEARTCYRHLAGRLGVAFFHALEEKNLLELRDGAPMLSRRGIAWFEDAGLAEQHWPHGKMCLDWTERRSHLGGALGALLTSHLFEKKWIARRKDGRALRITVRGCRELSRRYGIRAG